MGWVRNVALIKCIFGSGKPRGVGISGGRVYEPGEEMGKLVYEQPGNDPVTKGGFQVSRKGKQGKQRGAKGSKGNMPCI